MQSNRCPVCGRIIPAHTKECVYCLRDIEHPVKIVKVNRPDDAEEKKKWIPWFWGGLIAFLAVLAVRSFLRYVDFLLKGK